MPKATVESVQKFLKFNPERINQLSPKRDTSILMTTCYDGPVEAVELLVKHGADVNLKSKDGRNTALLQAINGKNIEVVNYLLDHTDVQMTQPILFGTRWLDHFHYTIATNNVKMFEILLAKYFAIIKEGGDLDPSEVADEAGPEERLIRLLVFYNQYMNPDFVVRCVDRGILDLDQQLVDLVHQVELGSGFLVATKALNEKLLGSEKGNATLEMVVTMLTPGFDPQQVQQVLNQNPQIDLTQSGESPILHLVLAHYIACDEDLNRLITYLLEKGVDINQPDRNGATPILLAMSNSFIKMEVIKRLEQAGADINAVDKCGENCLLYALSSADRDKMSYALDLVDINSTNELGETIAFRLDRFQNDPDYVEELVEKGLDLTRLDKRGNSPLFDMLNNLHISAEFIKCLTDRGAKLVPNHRGETLLIHLAKHIRHLEEPIVKLLVDLGIDVNHRDQDDQSVFDYINDFPPELTELYKSSIDFLKTHKINPQYSSSEIIEAADKYPNEICVACDESSPDLQVSMPCGHKMVCERCVSMLKTSKCVYCGKPTTYHSLATN
jgi:ankyrin repeat protein